MGLFKKHTYDNESPGRLAWRRFRRNIPAMVALGYVMVLSVVALFAYVVIPDKSPDANRMCLQIATQKPGFSTSFLKVKKEGAKSKGNLLTGFEDVYTYVPVEKATSETVSRSFPLGTDRYGRDMLSRLILGARVSMLVGIIAVLISLIIGVTLGAIAGYFGGWIDSLIQWIINVIWSIPTILLVIAVSIALGKGFMQVFIAVGLTMWVEVARMVRGQVLSLRQMEFVEASKALGFSHWRAIFVHILPNISGPLSVVAASNFASAILIEAGLSFIGFGVQPPTASWGTMIRDHYGYIILDNAYLAVLPGLAIVSVVLAFIMLGNGLRDAMDVKGVADRA
jgi:peptide/nickel transport system permease protein